MISDFLRSDEVTYEYLRPPFAKTTGGPDHKKFRKISLEFRLLT